MLVAVPVGLFSGIYMAEYASTKTRRISKPIIEILAGIPTVVYFFAALTVDLFSTNRREFRPNSLFRKCFSSGFDYGNYDYPLCFIFI